MACCISLRMILFFIDGDEDDTELTLHCHFTITMQGKTVSECVERFKYLRNELQKKKAVLS